MGESGLNSSATHSSNMKFLVLSACVALSSCSLVTHPNGAVVPADTPAVAAAKLSHFHAGGAVHPLVYGVAPVALVALPNGAVVPADTPEVVAAKAAHAAAGGAVHTVFPYAYGFHGLVAHPNGAVVPVEPADVVAARAEHLAAA